MAAFSVLMPGSAPGRTTKMRWLGELARRKVLKVGAAYLALAWALLQLTDILAPALELPDWTLRLVLLLLGLGFPVALLLAWQFNMTPDGIEADPGADQAMAGTRKRDWALLAAIAVLGIAAGVTGQRLLAPTVPSDDATQGADTTPARTDGPIDESTSIAVLPFVSMSGTPEDGYFADGLSEEILNSLANLPGLKVAGRTSSFSYKGQDQDIRTIARELGVAHVIEGSVRRQGETLRVTAQLIEAEEGFHLWSQTFDRDAGDALAIQSEIAAAVADKLRLSMLPRDAAGRALDGAMQQDYLEALGLIRENSHDSLARAVALLRPILQARPDFIPAYLPLADSVQRLGWYGLMPWDEAVEEMRTLSIEASRRAPDDLDARVLAALVPFAENDLAPTYDGYERILRDHRALADEAPNHPLLQLNTSDAARILDQHEVAMRYAERYIALEPRDPKGHMTLGQIARALGRDEEAIAAFRRGAEVAPRFFDVYWQWSRLLVRTGRFEEALAVAEACQRAGAQGCTATLADLYRVLRQPALERESEAANHHPMQAKYLEFERERKSGGYRAALAWVERQGSEAESLKRHFGDDLTTAALEAGAHAELLELRRWLSPGVFELDTPLLGWHLDAANEAGVALLRLGREDEARRMFQRVVEAQRRESAALRFQWAQLPEATALAWLGDIDGAMAVIRREVGNGWVSEYYFTRTNVDTPDPLVEPLRDRADFRALMDQVRARNAAAFARLKASGRELVPRTAPGLAGHE